MSKDKKNETEEIGVENESLELNEEPIVITDEQEQAPDTQKIIDEYKDIAQRIQAEFDNYRKRNAESVRIARSDGINDVIVALFPILDNFERGIGTIEDEKAKNGMELIYKQTIALLKKFDVEEIEALNTEFNPQFHHAIAQCEDAENSNKVVEVYQKGYKRKDKVLRPSMVKVAQ